MKVRGFAVFLAVALAVAATGAVYLYVQGVRHQTRTPSDMVTVIVPKQDIAAGTQLDSLISGGGFTTLSIPRDAVVNGAVTDLQQLRNKATQYPILQGEQVTAARLRGSSIQPPQGRYNIPTGHQALTVALDPQRVLGGGIQAQDHVVVYATITLPGQGPVTATVVPDVLVLQVVSPGGGGGLGNSSSGQSFLLLSLLPKDAEKVILAQEQGHIWLSLLPPNVQGPSQPAVSIPQLIKNG